MGMKYMLCITIVNGKDLGTYRRLVADKKLFVLLRLIANLCSWIHEVWYTMSTAADKNLRVKIGGPNCDLFYLYVFATFMIHWSYYAKTEIQNTPVKTPFLR